MLPLFNAKERANINYNKETVIFQNDAFLQHL